MVGFQYQIQGLSSQLVAGGGEKEEGEILVDNELRPADAECCSCDGQVMELIW